MSASWQRGFFHKEEHRRDHMCWPQTAWKVSLVKVNFRSQSMWNAFYFLPFSRFLISRIKTGELAMLTEFWTFPCQGLYCDNTQSEDVLSQQWVSSPRADTSSQFEIMALNAVDQNISVVVLSDDYGTGFVPRGKFENVAVISCRCSLDAYTKYQAGRSFQLMHRSSLWTKCLEGRNKERWLYIWGVRSFHWHRGPFVLEPRVWIVIDQWLTQGLMH